jgi:peptidyl-dipeptidase Dcp
MKPAPRSAAVGLALTLAAGPAAAQPEDSQARTPPADDIESAAAEPLDASANPLLGRSTLPLQYPRFDLLDDEHFAPAFDRGMEAHLAEVEAIAASPEAPTFDNTIVALERSGELLNRTASVFYNLVGADTNDRRQALQAEYAPKLAAHEDAVLLDAALFARVESLHASRDALGLDAEAVRLIERYYVDFVRAGAQLSEADKERLRGINSELATLRTRFTQNVLAEVNDAAVVVESRDELAGLPEASIAAAADAAAARGFEGQYVIALQNTTGQPPNAHLENRELRRRIHEASVARGSRGNEYDNTGVISRVMRLRAERARLLGYPHHAAYVLDDETAQTPEAVDAMLTRLAPAAVLNARREGAALQAMIDSERAADGEPQFELEPWDWAYYAEKVRQASYDFDETELKPYLELNSVLENGVFYAANRLYGLTFEERSDLPVYHPDVRVFDVRDADGSHLSIFLLDPYARESKRGGAWMNAYVSQSGLRGTKPVVANHLNIPKPPAGEPTLMTWDEVTTMFHEFGHALHGMFSDVTYPYFAGTRVPRDFVEFPSQVNEMWADWPEVLANYARHHETGEPMPQELLDKVLASAKFNQGFATTEYLAAAMLDQSWHRLEADEVPAAQDVMAFERTALETHGVAYAPVPPRYRTPYFSHIMGGYAAGYYSYIWSEVLDANSVEWFETNGGLTRENGDHFRETLLSRGGSRDALELFRAFAGHEPRIAPLLERRGLTAPGSDDSAPAPERSIAPPDAGGR